MSKFETRLARLEAARKPKTEWRILFSENYPTADALKAEVAKLEADGVRVWTVEFVDPKGDWCNAGSPA